MRHLARIMIAAALIGFGLAGPATAEADKTFRLAAPDAMAADGFLKHLLPRFSLKTGVRITLVGPEDEADARLGPEGPAVLADPAGAVWHFDAGTDEDAARFADWLQSEVGKRTIDTFAAAAYSSDVAVKEVAAVIEITGDAKLGAELSLTLCGRCHVIGEQNRMKGLGSTPSFMVLRTLGDWEQRFSAFYALNPHPSFTQVEDVSPPFDPMRPPPIAPLELTLDDLEAVMAYVATIDPADLGRPVASQ